MRAFIGKILGGLRQLAGLIIPIFKKPRDFHAWHGQILWMLRILLYLVICTLLLFVNWLLYTKKVIHLQFPRLSHLPFDLEITWMPLLFTLFVLIAWVGAKLWQWFMEEEASIHPDIDEAWHEAMAALHAARLDLNDLQVYLVHGQPKGGEKEFFRAASLDWKVNGVPDGPEAPLHVYATRDALFISCAGASLLGAVAACLNSEATEEEFVTNEAGDVTAGPGDRYKTIAAGGESSEHNEAFARIRALRAVAQGRELTEEEQAILRDLERNAPLGVRRKAVTLTPVAKDMNLHLSRLRHLCRLIVRDRRPYCPINGTYVLVPLAAAEGDAHFGQVGAFIARELASARGVLQVVGPLVVVVCDWETLPGFAEFIKAMEDKDPNARKRRRFGQQFVMLPAVKDPVKLMQSLEATLRWTFVNRLTKEVYKLFKHERGKAEAYPRVIRENGQLYLFLHAMRQREARLARLIAQGVLDPAEENHFVMGCYLVGSGKTPREQAFTAATMDKLLACKGDHVSWTAAGFAEEAALQRWTWLGYVVCGIVTLLAIAAVAYVRLR